MPRTDSRQLKMRCRSGQNHSFPQEMIDSKRPRSSICDSAGDACPPVDMGAGVDNRHWDAISALQWSLSRPMVTLGGTGYPE